MCGIVGYIGVEQAAPIILDGLAKLEYRGYDSAGVALVCQDGVQIVKELGRISNLKDKSFYDTGVDINSTDEILILQTCSHHKDYKKYKKKYLLIVAKKIKEN